MNDVYNDCSLFSPEDVYLFRQGTHFQLYNKFGSHLLTHNGVPGCLFSVWAPNARRVTVMGDFNGWNRDAHPLSLRSDGSGIWEGFVPGVSRGSLYKYYIISNFNNFTAEKTDPYAYLSEIPPQTSSIVWDLEYAWNDQQWMAGREKNNALDAPFSIYEVHLGSWRRNVEQNHRFLTYRELAKCLPQYVQDMGFTHVEFLPVMEHPFYGSWGYQTLGYFAATTRFGTPQDLMFLIDSLHQAGIGVILDWVPSHFPSDGHGLVYYDGTHLFEHSDPQKGFHPDWKSYIFNNGRNEVKEFLISSALFWLDQYHADGLRVDAVASMLYLDYSRKEGEWCPNIYGGRENLESIEFIRNLNETVYKKYPDVQMFAEESTAWSKVSRPNYDGGLGFGMKWNMGWMHDTLKYISKDPLFRKYHHNDLTFSMLYAYTENFVLSLSHDEVVHGKGSLLNKMPGDEWQRFANLRLLLGYMFGHVGKKLLFMGAEFGQSSEWYHERSLDWHLLEYPLHAGVQKWMRAVNRFYQGEPAMHKCDFDPAGFEWTHCGDWERSILAFVRKNPADPRDVVFVVSNFTPAVHRDYRIGIPLDGFWREVLNSDAAEFGGSGVANTPGIRSQKQPFHGRPYSVSLTVPPLATLFFKYEPSADNPPRNGKDRKKSPEDGEVKDQL